MSKITFTDEGIVTRNPLVGAMFLGKVINNTEWLSDIRSAKERIDGCFILATPSLQRLSISDCLRVEEITIPYPLVADAMKPVEGKPCFLIHEHTETAELQSTMFMVYIEEYKPELEEEGYIFVAANPLTTVTPVELRELIARINA